MFPTPTRTAGHWARPLHSYELIRLLRRGRCRRRFRRFGRLARRGLGFGWFAAFRGSATFRHLRQRLWAVRQSVQKIDHVGALAVARQAGKGHGRARDIAARILEELVQFLVGPLAALGLHGGGEVEAAAILAALVADDIPQVGADPVRAALFEGVTGLALLGSRLALFDRGLGQQHFDRLLRLLGGGLVRGGLFHRDGVTGLGRLFRYENRPGADAERERDQTGTKNGAKDFVQFEGIHRIRLPKGARSGTGWVVRRGPGGEGQIPVCLASGNPYKRRYTRPLSAWQFDIRHARRGRAGGTFSDVPDRNSHTGPHGLDPAARQAFGRHCGRADDRARPAPRAGGRHRRSGGGDRFGGRPNSGGKVGRPRRYDARRPPLRPRPHPRGAAPVSYTHLTLPT